MITLEGSSEPGAVWVSWRPSTQNDPIVLPAGLGAYVGISPPYSPVLPCAMVLPPMSGKLLFHTDWTPFGGRVGHVEVGALVGTKGDHHTPNPCKHSTVSGTLCPLGDDGKTFARFRFDGIDSPGEGPFYNTSCERLSFLGGKSADPRDMRVFNNRAKLVDISYYSAPQHYWWNQQLLLMSHLPSDFASASHPNKHAEHGMWMVSRNPPIPGDDWNPHIYHRSTWTHVTANQWIEEYWAEYHTSASYTPKYPVGWSGVPFLLKSVYVKRTHQLKYLQHSAPGVFTGYFDITQDIDYYSCPFLGSPAVNKHFASAYANCVYLDVMDPGLVSERNLALPLLDDYCRLAATKAVHLYSEKEMGIARSVAISDVSALESNWIENFSQVGGYKEIFDPLLEGYAAVKSGDTVTAVKSLASAYLVYKYCVAPTVADSKDLSKNLESQISRSVNPVYSNERRRGRYSRSLSLGDREALLGYFCTYHLQMKDTSFATVVNALERLGLDPSASNAWDFVPFSFVLDWFYSVGSALEKISAYNNARLSRELKSRIQSFKCVWPLSSMEVVKYIPYNWKVAGSLLYSWYDRRVGTRWGTFDPFAGQSIDGPSWGQSIQGGALLISALL